MEPILFVKLEAFYWRPKCDKSWTPIAVWIGMPPMTEYNTRTLNILQWCNKGIKALKQHMELRFLCVLRVIY